MINELWFNGKSTPRMDKIDALDIDSLNSTIHQLDETTEAFSSTVDAINSIFGH